ncbi:hypothetical protein EOK95_26380, partial [Enterobacter hormaechei]
MRHRQHHQLSLFSLHPLCSLGAKCLPDIISYPGQLDAAARARRLSEDVSIVVFERGSDVS